ncbi:hypothetical protein GCM10025862_23710 [Arsenicicoccus piscis]|uniref:Uncharacterized protein n=1 Tax=Arsenicicoccus piscis TaxID=673954 RepID=A0ABQ6HPF3_9MICO|nr:hypothetical protein GCM10025862_23710 [Arsenicicoccus piscis]
MSSEPATPCDWVSPPRAIVTVSLVRGGGRSVDPVVPVVASPPVGAAGVVDAPPVEAADEGDVPDDGDEDAAA